MSSWFATVRIALKLLLPVLFVQMIGLLVYEQRVGDHMRLPRAQAEKGPKPMYVYCTCTQSEGRRVESAEGPQNRRAAVYEMFVLSVLNLVIS
jgi:hypothetical protein